MRHYSEKTALRLLLIPGLTLLMAFWSLNVRSAGAEQVDQPQALALQAAETLWKNCYSCHNELVRKGGLSMHSHPALLQGGAHGAALIPGKGSESRMVLMMEGLIEPMMPQGGYLLDEEIDRIRRWIDAGAPAWPDGLARPRLNIPEIAPRVEIDPAISSLAFAPDGLLLAAGTYQEVRLLSVQNQKLVKRLAGHSDLVRSVAFSPDGELLAAAGGLPAVSGEIEIWDLQTTTVLHHLQGHSDCIYSVAFSPDGNTLATASYDRTIRLWDVRSGKQRQLLKDHVDAVFSLAFSPDGKWLASASADRTVKLWEVSSGRRILTLGESTDALHTVAFHPHSPLIAAAGADKRIRIWKLSEKGGELVRSAFAHAGSILKVAFTPDGNTLISAGSDRLVKFWNLESMLEEKVWGPQSEWVLSLSVSPDGGLIAAGRFDGSLDIYEVEGNGQASKLQNRP